MAPNAMRRGDKKYLNEISKILTEKNREIKNESFKNLLINLTPTKDSNYSLWTATERLKRPQ